MLYWKELDHQINIDLLEKQLTLEATSQSATKKWEEEFS
jgi:hypothetical protein